MSRISTRRRPRCSRWTQGPGRCSHPSTWRSSRGPGRSTCMATAIAKSYDVVSLEDIEPGPEHDGRVPLNIRRHFGIQGFGVRANRSVGDGHVVGEHDRGGARRERPGGALPGASGRRRSTSTASRSTRPPDDGLRPRPGREAERGCQGGGHDDPRDRRHAGQACELSVGEAMHDMWDPYAGGLRGRPRALQPVLEERPEALVLFNVACMEARLGRTEMRSPISSRRSRTMIGSRSTSAPTGT